MRYGIVSDIHGNLEALKVVLAALDSVDAVVCLGDIIGYGPNPEECCDLIRGRNIPTVIGNHDAAVSDRTSLDWFNPFAKLSIEWTAPRLSTDNHKFLSDLPLMHKFDDFIMVHGSLSSPKQFEYITSPWEARATFGEMDGYSLCLLGHTHCSEYYAQNSDDIGTHRIDMSSGGTIQLKPAFSYIVNVGSVGQPRDGNPQAAAGVYDTDNHTLEFLRLEYPVGDTQRKMQEAGFPHALWSRLSEGR